MGANTNSILHVGLNAQPDPNDRIGIHGLDANDPESNLFIPYPIRNNIAGSQAGSGKAKGNMIIHSGFVKVSNGSIRGGHGQDAAEENVYWTRTDAWNTVCNEAGNGISDAIAREAARTSNDWWNSVEIPDAYCLYDWPVYYHTITGNGGSAGTLTMYGGKIESNAQGGYRGKSLWLGCGKDGGSYIVIMLGCARYNNQWEWGKKTGDSGRGSDGRTLDVHLYGGDAIGLKNANVVYRHNLTLNYNACSGSVSPTTQNVVEGISDCRQEFFPMPLRTHYTFKGWEKSARCTNHTNNGYSAGDVIQTYLYALSPTQNATVNLYAMWEGNPTNITLDFNGGGRHVQAGTCGMFGCYNECYCPDPYTINDAAHYDSINIRNLPLQPRYIGYTFQGFYDARCGGTQFINANMSGVRRWDKDVRNVTLYARWQSNPYKVKLNPRGGQVAPDTIMVGFGNDMPQTQKPTRNGWTFLGFYDDTIRWDKQYYTASMVSARVWDKSNDSSVLYARWGVNNYIVTLNPNGGTAGTESVVPTYGQLLPPGAISPTRTGYNFCGYYDTTSTAALACVGTKYYEGAPMMTPTRIWRQYDKMLYAGWNKKIFMVTLNPNGGTGGIQNVQVQYEADMPAAQKPTLAGQGFLGFFDAPTGGIQYYNSDMTSTRVWDQDRQGAVLYAHWGTQLYSVTFDKTGGSGGSISVEAQYNQPMPAATAPTRLGYTFKGYYEAPNGIGTKYYNADMSSNSLYALTTAATIYAHWLVNDLSRTITFDANVHGSETPVFTTPNAIVPYNVEIPSVPLPSISIPILNGYEFMGYWNVNALTGGTRYYNADGTPAISAWNAQTGGDIILYARWKYWISYQSMEEAASPATIGITDIEFQKGVNQNLHDGAGFSRTGYEVGAWQQASWLPAHNVNEQVTAVEPFVPNYALTTRYFYAIWKPIRSEITLNHQNGSPNTAFMQDYDSVMPPMPAPVRAGYTFDGYYDATTGGLQYYTNTMSSQRKWNKTSNTMLYARWIANIYNITLARPDGNGGSDAVSIAYNDTMPMADAPQRVGYSLAGFYDAPSGGTQYYNSDMTSARNWDIPSDTTLYAQWTANNYRINLNQQGGTGGTNQVQAVYDAAMPSVAIAPVRIGYRFMGYYDDSIVNNSGIGNLPTEPLQYYSDALASQRNWDKPNDDTLYARWAADTFSLNVRSTFLPCRSDTTLRVHYDEQFILPNQRWCPGFEFRNYTLAPNNHNAQRIYSDFHYQFTSDTTIWALWDTAKYYVFFNSDYDDAEMISPKIVYYGRKIGVLPPAERPGYIFQGWYYPDTTGKLYTQDSIYKFTEGVDFISKWKPIPYTLTLKAAPCRVNNADSATVRVICGSRIGQLPTARCDSPNYFTGWYDQQQGNGANAGNEGVRWTETTFYPSNFNRTIYAHWKKQDITAPPSSPTAQIQVDSSTQDAENPRYFVLNRCDINVVNIRFSAVSGLTIYYKDEPVTNIKLDIKQPKIYCVKYELEQNGNRILDSVLIEKRIAFDKIAHIKQGRILFVDNNTSSNGGYTFTSYQWMRDGEPVGISGSAYFYEGMDGVTAGFLLPQAKYSVQVTTISGSKFETCPASFALTSSVEMSLYPNPVSYGDMLTITLPHDEVKQVEVYTISGMLLRQIPAAASPMQISVDFQPGMYIIKAGTHTIGVAVR
jgi:hypothetical protein